MRRVAVLLALSIAVAVAVGHADAAAPRPYQNCTQLNATYPHGVGRANATDKTTFMTRPVTTFKRSTALYNRAISYNKRLDADNDGVACEKP